MRAHSPQRGQATPLDGLAELSDTLGGVSAIPTCLADLVALQAARSGRAEEQLQCATARLATYLDDSKHVLTGQAAT